MILGKAVKGIKWHNILGKSETELLNNPLLTPLYATNVKPKESRFLLSLNIAPATVAQITHSLNSQWTP